MKDLRWMLVALIFGSLAPVSVSANFPPNISVVGEAEKKVMPDIAIILVGVSDNNLFSETAAEENTASVKKIKKVLSGLRINPNNIKIAEPSITSSQNYWGRQGDTPFNFKISRYLSIELNLKKWKKEKVVSEVTKILDALRKGGVNVWGMEPMMNQQAAIVQYAIKDEKAYDEELINEAIKDARGRAKKMSVRLGVKIGGVYSVAEKEIYNMTVDPCEREECTSLIPKGKKKDSFEEIHLKKKIAVSFKIIE